MTPSDDTPVSTPAFDPEPVRDKYAEERAKRMRRGPGGDPRPARRRARSPSTRRPVHAVRRARTRSPRTSTSPSSGRGCRAWSSGAKLREAGPAQGLPDRQGRRHRRHVVLEPLPRGDVRRRVVHLHADARGDGLRPDHPLRVRRRDPAAPRGDRHASTTWSTTRCSTPGSRPASGTTSRRGGSSAPTAATRSGPGTWSWRVGILNLMKLPVIPGMEEFEGKAFHTARWDYGYTGGGAGRPAPHQAGRQGGRRHRRGRERHPGVPPLAESAKHVYVFQRTPSADRSAGQPPDDRRVRRAAAAGLAAGADGELHAVMIGPAGRARPRRRRVDAPHRAAQQPAIVEPGMTPSDIAAMVEAFDFERDGGAPASDRRRSSPTRRPRRCSSRTTGTAASGRASTTSTWSRSTSPT